MSPVRHNTSLSVQRPGDGLNYAQAALLIEPPEWTADAICAQTDPEVFFPEKGASTRQAKSMCDRCPVAAECADHALANDERFGIWGGLSERERRKIKRLLESA